MKINLIVLAISMLFIFGCTGEKKTPVLQERISVGIVNDANVIPTSFNERIKTQVKCDSLYVIVYGTPELKLGSEAFIETYDNGRRFFVSGTNSYRIK